MDRPKVPDGLQRIAQVEAGHRDGDELVRLREFHHEEHLPREKRCCYKAVGVINLFYMCI